jgi:hypothetical protein
VKPKAKKCPELDVLSDYSVNPPASFWQKFPFNPLPVSPKTSVNISELEKKVDSVSNVMTNAQVKRARECIKSLKFGADSCQGPPLPPCYCQNSKSTVLYGEEVTDTIASWVKQKFVAGPFDQPPMANFRVNPLVAVDQDDKVRLVMNVSLPTNASFNDNIVQQKVEKVEMSSARSVSYLIHEHGIGAWMSKMDKKDAYKIIPASIPDIRLQGFMWLGKFFAETQQIFGAETAVFNYDRLGNTVKTVAVLLCKCSDRSVPRQLDDTVKIGKKDSDDCRLFTQEYKKVCADIGIKLAENCPKFEKAFENSQYGKILGILFDTTDLTWKLPVEKAYKTLFAIDMALKNDFIGLRSMQKLMGRLNDVCLMCPFLHGYKRALNDDLGHLQREGGMRRLSVHSKRDLLVWVGFLQDENQWFPICPRPAGPPVNRKEFSSDAAGGNSLFRGKIGCGNAGFLENGELFFVNQLFWPENGLIIKKDVKGAKFENKTTTLEMIGIIIPFLLIPDQLVSQHILLKVDNTGCIFGWQNKSVSGDNCASILIRALHLISAYLGSVIYMEHLPRVSSWDARLVDRLSREKTTTSADRHLLHTMTSRTLPPRFLSWLEDPDENFSLANDLLSEVEKVCKL